MDSHDRQRLGTNFLFVASFLLTSFVRGHLLLADRSQAGDPTVRLTSGSLNNGRWVKGLCGSILLMSLTVIFGCTTVVTLLQPSDQTSITKCDYGLVVGRMHLVWNGKDQRTDARRPLNIGWRLTEEEWGTQLMINHVLVDGPFVLGLPAGLYRLMVVSFDKLAGRLADIPAGHVQHRTTGMHLFGDVGVDDADRVFLRVDDATGVRATGPRTA